MPSVLKESVVYCYVCGKTRHIARNCYHRKGPYSKFSKSANLVEVEEEESEDTITNSLEVALAKFQNLKRWYMDSSCRIHLTGQKEALVNVKKVKGRKLTTAYGEPHNIASKDKVLLKADSREIKITNFLQLPSTKRNLLLVDSQVDIEKIIVITNKNVFILDYTIKQNVLEVRH